MVLGNNGGEQGTKEKGFWVERSEDHRIGVANPGVTKCGV